ncbi:uncharacterized protein APUU_50037A [Aspergillus puulaauensis]|uniref:HMA domain-containing protein n=1 Tax=Aspergillus puulaauensis TaxID=1220207 RepID=A0A7R7XPI0_9EURO|nr:uncharacterized protein APUU_50037A [Aspergillus puulaauensis]BCS25326.1 hypothetical protein APUU_50037A [Aspergillus puulaauensis]
MSDWMFLYGKAIVSIISKGHSRGSLASEAEVGPQPVHQSPGAPLTWVLTLATQSFNTGDDLPVIQKNLSARVVESGIPRDDDLVSVVDGHLTGTRIRITLSISATPCSSCFGKITNTLNDQPWVQSADVNLLASSDSPGPIAYLLPKRQSNPSTLADIWRVSYFIRAITCSSCVGTVTDTLIRNKWITKLDENIVPENATVELQGKEHLEEVVALISEMGYAATLGEVERSAPSE